jgi:hypothetical protein
MTGVRSTLNPQRLALLRRFGLEVRNLLHDVGTPTPWTLKALFPLAFGLGDGQGRREVLPALSAQKLIDRHVQFSSMASHPVSPRRMT